MPTTIENNLSAANQAKYVYLENQRDVSSVLLLREMQDTNDLRYRKSLFEQAADQEASHISEVLNGTVRTEYQFDAKDGKLYLLQPNGVKDWRHMHSNGVERARLKAAIDPRFKPYAAIAEAELEEAHIQEMMVRKGIPAAMVKLSLSGDDVMGQEQLSQIGRDPKLQRAFLRVSVFDGEKLKIYSRSIDGLGLNDGRNIVSGWGLFKAPKVTMPPDATSIDILKSNIIFDESEIDIQSMHNLADKLVDAYDIKLLERTGAKHKAGRNPEGVDTLKFVSENIDLMNVHMAGLSDLSSRNLPLAVLANQTNDLRYDIMASFKRRMDGTWVSTGSLAESVANSGSGERAVGTNFYGCDTVVGTNANVASTGYVNSGAAEKSLMELSGKKLRCTNQNCKKEVVVPDKDLREGKLSCKECGLVYDVCNKESSFRDVGDKNEEVKESPMAKWNREYDHKKQQEKLEKTKKAKLEELAQ